MKKPVLELSTLVEHATVAIDGHEYELLTVDDFGLRDYARLLQLQETVETSRASASLESEERAASIAGALNNFVAMVMPGLPVEVLGKLRDVQKVAIMKAFSEAAGLGTERALPPESQPTGENTSPDSSAPTGETPSAG